MKATRSAPLLPEKIITALYQKDYKALKRFLTRETVNLREEGTGRTLLMLAVGIEDGLEQLRFLIASGADVNLADHKGQHTALHFAAFDANKEVARILLEAGANPNAQDASGYTPLHIVVLTPDPRNLLVFDLISHGADPDRKDVQNSTAKKDAKKTGQLNLLLCMSSHKPKRKPAGQRKQAKRRT
jgi:ankyrin repeat protein